MRVIIVGAGKVGFSLAKHLSEENNDVVVIEYDDERRGIVQSSLDVMTLAGNGASAHVLLEAGIKEAEMLIAVTDSDEVNMIACMTAKRLGVVRTIARIRNEDYARQDDEFVCSTLGVDIVINPELVTAIEISRVLKTPATLDIEDFAGGKVRMLEVKLRKNSELTNIPLHKLTLPPNILVAGIMRKNKMIIPRGFDQLRELDHVFFIGETKAIEGIEGRFMVKRSKLQKVIIIGAGRIGRYLATMLEEVGLSIKVIDKDRQRCEFLAKQLTNGIVLCGDGADIDLLTEEGVEHADAVICLTDDDKLNMLIALLTKHLGAEKTFVRVGRAEYTPLMEQVGVDVAITPQLITAGTILRLARRADIISLSLLEGAKAEAMEILVVNNSPIAGKKLRDANFPNGCLVGSIVRGNDIIIPTGNDYLMTGDRIVVFTLPDTASKIIELFKGRQ